MFVPFKNPEDRKRYARQHYLANQDVYKTRAAASNPRQKALIRECIVNAKDKPCADCGIKYPYYVMQFDHRGDDDKVYTISQFNRKGFSLKRLMAEIEKCDVVCANCHAERTFRRSQSNAPTGPVPCEGVEPSTHPV